LVTRYQLAEILEVAPDQVTRMEREGLPVESRGAGSRPSRYLLAKAVPWYLARERDRLAGSAEATSLDAERARLAKAQARRTELDIRRKEGELVPLAEVTEALTSLLATVRARLLAIPSALGPGLAAAASGGPRAAEDLVRQAIESALTELASWRPA
jgi:phage terminase Nu1 subunit (DNA packaging protein)